MTTTIDAAATNVSFTTIADLYGKFDSAVNEINFNDYIANNSIVSTYINKVPATTSDLSIDNFRGTERIPTNLSGIRSTNLSVYYDVSFLHCYAGGTAGSISTINNLSPNNTTNGSLLGTIGTAFANKADSIVSFSAANQNMITTYKYINTNDLNPYVYEGWFKFTATPSANRYIMGNLPGQSSRTALCVIYIRTTGLLTIWERNSTTTIDATNTSSIIDSNWHHIVVNGDAITTKLYVDMVEVASLNRIGGTTSIDDASGTYKISGMIGGFIDMQVGPVRAYEGVSLTTSEIKTHYYLERYKITNTYYDMDFLYTNAGTYIFTVPEGITAISILCIGGGGGGARGVGTNSGGAGGGCTWVNKIGTSAGTRYIVIVGNGGARSPNSTNRNGSNGEDTYFKLYTNQTGFYVRAGGGEGGKFNTTVNSAGGVGGASYVIGFSKTNGSSGGVGGAGNCTTSTSIAPGGGGAGGYNGPGGFGGGTTAGSGSSDTGSSGGNGTTNGGASGGGGAGLYGFNRVAPSKTDPGSAFSGSRGEPNYIGPAPYNNLATWGYPGQNGDGTGGTFGGGAGSTRSDNEGPGNGGRGAVRIICHTATSTNPGFKTTSEALAATIATFVNGLAIA